MEFGHFLGFGIGFGFPSIATCPVTESAILRFHHMRVRLADDMQIGGNDIGIDYPIICTHGHHGEMFHSFPESLKHMLTTIADFKGKDAASGIRHSKPYP